VAERVLRGRYRLDRHIAKGGMAQVYLAEDQLLSRTVAVKILFPELAEDDAFVERFRREARAAASLNHHNIVSVYDFGDDEGAWFIVMEYVEGPTLRDIIRREGPLEPARATEIASEVAAALAAAHTQGIVHRDVKPANVLITKDTGTVKVTDFGIARAANARQGLTMPGTVLGTATYVSPEQAQGHTVDHRTDIYSLGLVLYEMLAGRPPFTGESPVAVAYQALSQEAQPPSTHNPDVPPALDAIVARAMSKDPQARYATAEEFRAALLDVDRAVGDPDATVAIASPVAAAGEPTSVASPTSVLPPVTPAPGADRLQPRPLPPDVYRRRRAGVIAALAVLAITVIAFLALMDSDDGQGTVAVPGVVGLTVEEAQDALERDGLRSQLRDRAVAGEANQVVDQDPDAGLIVQRNSVVTLFVPAATSTTPATATTTAPTTTVAPTTTRPPTTTTTVAPTTTTAAPTTTTLPPPTTLIIIPTSLLVSTTTP
jgi:tRNA A-37 threonylcarbamoyl transferase component Bud32/beta-lactam-binding protein with PASTA domain